MNSVVLIGRLTRDPELRHSGNNLSITSFTLAVDRPFAKDGEQSADFPRVVVFGKQAENCANYLRKGRLVAVQGRISTGSYDKPDGTRVYTTDVIADRVQFLEKVDRSGQGSGDFYRPAEQSASSSQSFDDVDVDIPSQFQTIDEDIPF